MSLEWGISKPLTVPVSCWPGSQESEAPLGTNQHPPRPRPSGSDCQQCSRHPGPGSCRVLLQLGTSLVCFHPLIFQVDQPPCVYRQEAGPV